MLERNPTYRERYYEAEPAAGDSEGQALVEKFRGRRLPMVDRVEVSIIEEAQPRWLAFLNGQIDFVRVPSAFANFAAPTGALAPNLSKRGVTARKYVNPDFTMSWFNMEDTVVGGYAPEKVALRRAIALGRHYSAVVSLPD